MKKAQVILLSCTAVFLCILLGLFIGRNLTPSYRVDADDQRGANTSEAAFTDGKVNINTAGIPELVMLPGIGEGIAQRIIDYRQVNGPFKTTDDLLLVDGIGVSRLDAIQDYITVGG